MRPKFTDMVYSLLISLSILFVLDIFSSTVIPLMGLHKLKLAFNVLIILFLGFYVDTPYLPVFVLIIQFFHSIFTIEGWAYGTFAGVVIGILLGHLKDILQFRSAMFTILITFFFQYLWFIIVSGLIYFQIGNTNYLLERLSSFIPESIILAILSPFFFSLLKRIWKVGGREDNTERVDV